MMRAFFVLGLSSMASLTHAETGFSLPPCDDARTSGWSFYCSEPTPVEDPEDEDQDTEAQPDVTIAVPEPTPDEEKYPATVAMMAFRAMVDEARHRAVLDPSEENVRAFMELNAAMAKQAGRFTESWQRILFDTPELNALINKPMAAAGITVYQDQRNAAEVAALQKAASERGILFVFDGSERCGICRVQGEVLAALQDIHNVAILAVSRDGGTNESFPDAFIDEGRLQELGLAEFPTPTLALVNPDQGEVEVIGSGLLTLEEILERVYVITEIPVGERY